MNSLKLEQKHSMANITGLEEEPARLAVKTPARVLGAGLALGIVVDWLFYDKLPGISWLIFTSLVIGTWIWISRQEESKLERRNLWLILPLLFFASMVFGRANNFLTTLNILAILSLFAYLAFFFTNGRVDGVGIASTFIIPLRVGAHSLAQTPPIVAASVDLQAVRQQGRRSLFPILRGGLLALPVLIVFTLLLTSADLVFADRVENFLALDFLGDLLEWSWRGTLIIMAAWIITGGFAFALQRRCHEDDQGALANALSRLPQRISLGFIESSTVLMLINVLFLAFVAVQFTYLFGGSANIDLEGYTYAEYARRGFFELLTVAILSLALILGLNWFTRRESKSQIRLFNGMSSIMVTFVLIMLLSAFKRMRLYETAFGYTELRLYVYVFMVWLGVLLAWFLITLWRRPDRFAIGLIITAMGFLVTLNMLNPDAFIARQNLDRYQVTGKLDAAYLTRLSDDAVPQLVHALSLTKGDTEVQLKPACSAYSSPGFDMPSGRSDDCYATPYQIVYDELSGRYQNMTANEDWQRWQSFHVSRWMAYGRLRDMGRS